jgi:hypothetical protein
MSMRRLKMSTFILSFVSAVHKYYRWRLAFGIPS